MPLVAAAALAAVLLHSGGAEAEPQPDPSEVRLFLAQLEAQQRLADGEAERKKGHEKRLLQVVEGAATRAPSDAVINKLETVVADKLAG